MTPEAKIYTERIDDIPLLVSQQEKMGIPEVLDRVIRPHGNRQGLSVGWLITGWLSYIVSEGDHRMVEVEGWVADHQESLSHLIPHPVRVKDFTDDRLADVLGLLSKDEVWDEVESQLGQHLIRVYDLKTDRIRLDSTSVSVYHDEEGQTLFRKGHSKDHRPDLAQFKVMLGALDPLGLPVATLVVPGNCADDPLYLPTFRRARKVVGTGGRLYIGDTKMGALETRAFIEAGDDFYLSPLAQVGDVGEIMQELLVPVYEGRQDLQRIETESVKAQEGEGEAGDAEPLALGFEGVRQQQACIDDQEITWQERLLVIHSPQLARKRHKGLDGRLGRAEKALLELTPQRGRGKKQWEDLGKLEGAVEAILKKHRVDGLLEVCYAKEVEKRAVRQYKDRPARTEERIRYVLNVHYNGDAIHQARRMLGWRLFVTNAPKETLDFSEAVKVYRGSAHIEHNFARLKGRPLGIRPFYVQREDPAKGLGRLMSLALRVLTLIEYVVRENLQGDEEALAGLYAGNPKRKTERPTTERLLKAFKGLALTLVELSDQTIRHVTPLSDLQRRILKLVGLSTSIYEDLTLPGDPIPL